MNYQQRKAGLKYFTEKGIKLWNSPDIHSECLIRRACWGVLKVFLYKITQQKYLEYDTVNMTDKEYLEMSEEVKEYYERLQGIMIFVDEIINTPEQLEKYEIAIEICNRIYLKDGYKISVNKDNERNEIIVSKSI